MPLLLALHVLAGASMTARLAYLFMSELTGFCEHAVQDQPGPLRNFARQYLFGLLKCRSAVVADSARALEEPKKPGGKRPKLFFTEKRLLRNLANPRFDEAALMTRVMEIVSGLVGDGTGVTYLVDRGDIVHARGHVRGDGEEIVKGDLRIPTRRRGMERAWLVHDGSESGKSRAAVIRPGWYYVGVQAVLADGRRFPVWRQLFSSEPGSSSEFHVTLDVLARLAPYAGPARAWIAFDAGYDAKDFMRGLDDEGYENWVVRAGRSRQVIDAQGSVLDVNVFADTIRTPYKATLSVPERPDEQIEYGSRLCYLKDDHGRRIGTARALVAFRRRGSNDSTMVLLVSRPVTHHEALQAIRAYKRRWAVEHAFELEKSTDEYGFSLEEVRVQGFVAVGRVLQFVMLAALFLSLLAPKPLTRRILDLLAVFKETVIHVESRLLRAIGQELLGRLSVEAVRALVARWLRHG